MDMTRHYNDYSSADDCRTWWLNSPTTKRKTAKAQIISGTSCSSENIFRFTVKPVFARFNRIWLRVQGFHRLLGKVAIYASNRQARFYVVHGLPAAQQFQLLAIQTSGVVASN